MYFLSFLSSVSPCGLLVRVKINLPQGSKYSQSSSRDNQLLVDQSRYAPHGQRKCWITRTSYRRNKIKIPIFKWHFLMMSNQNGTCTKERIKIDVLYKPIGSSDKYKCIFLPFYIQIRDQNICFQQQTK